MLSATVILYNPEINILENISTYATYVDTIIVIDNSEEKNKDLINQLLSLHSNIEYIFNRGNLGIATALNIACEFSIEQGYEWLLTMDQDSSFKYFKDYLDCFIQLSEKNSIAIISPNISKKSIDINQDKCQYIDELATITSGSLLNLKLFHQIGKFEDKLFIDSVDVDYCLKARLNGFRVITFKNVYLEHYIGKTVSCKNLFLNKYKTIKQHNPLRVYYGTRNKLYMLKKYKDHFPELYNTSDLLVSIYFKKIKKIVLYEDDKVKKIKAILKGTYHYLISRYGRCD